MKEERTIVDPVAQANTTSNERTFNHHKFTTIGRLCRFRLPRWDCASVDAIANACDDATDNKVWKLERGTLQKCTSSHCKAANHDCAATTQWVTDKNCDDGTNETS